MQNKIHPRDKDVPKRWGHCGHEIWVNCKNSTNPDLQAVARLIGKQASAKIIMEFVSGIKTPEGVRIQSPHIEFLVQIASSPCSGYSKRSVPLAWP